VEPKSKVSTREVGKSPGEAETCVGFLGDERRKGTFSTAVLEKGGMDTVSGEIPKNRSSPSSRRKYRGMRFFILPIRMKPLLCSLEIQITIPEIVRGKLGVIGVRVKEKPKGGGERKKVGCEQESETRKGTLLTITNVTGQMRSIK